MLAAHEMLNELMFQKIKFFVRIVLGHEEPRHQDITGHRPRDVPHKRFLHGTLGFLLV